MRLQNIYDSIPIQIDLAVERVISKYEWIDAQNPYRAELYSLDPTGAYFPLEFLENPYEGKSSIDYFIDDILEVFTGGLWSSKY